ncbi:YbaN family protein [Parasphingorhabdus sp.]|uniref:YbaN family protein n=1 Tax=Parasphingorhabdus sp. TaxID=2709688 RepID=UPI0032652BD6
MPALAENTPTSAGKGNLRKRGAVARTLWPIMGLLLVGVGFLGAFLPLLPTTVFLILASACFARSSPRLESWLLSHPRFGPGLRAWRQERAISRKARIAAWSGMAVGFGLFLLGAQPRPLVAVGVAVALLLCALWIASRPLPSRSLSSGAAPSVRE